MKVTLNAKELACALKSAALLVEARTTIPILSHALMIADGEALTIHTTNMDQTFIAYLGATVSDGGRFTVPVRQLLALVRDAEKGAEISLSTGERENQITVKCGAATSTLNGLYPTDFPHPSEKKRPCVFDLAPSDLRHLIDMTRRCISTEETRYYLNGLYLHAPETAPGLNLPKTLRIVATDGHRMAKADMDLPLALKVQKVPSVIIPKLTVSVLRRLIDKAKEPITVELSDDHGFCLRFSSSNWSLISKDIDGTFPDCGRVIPTSNDKHVEVNRAALAGVVKRVAKIKDGRNDGLNFIIDAKASVLTVKGRSVENGSTKESLTANCGGVEMEIGLNWRYVLDAIDVMAGETVVLDIANNTSPVILRDPADADYLHVLMPMRI